MPSHDSLNRRVPFAGFWTVVLLAIAGTSFARSGSASARIQIKDTADMFSKKAIDEAKEILGRTGNLQIPVVIETIEALEGQAIEEATRRHAEKSGGDGIYVLISRRDHKIDVLASKAFASMMPVATREQIQKAFIQGLRSGDFDAGLLAGAKAISHEVLPVKRGANAADWTGRAPPRSPDRRRSSSATRCG